MIPAQMVFGHIFPRCVPTFFLFSRYDVNQSLACYLGQVTFSSSKNKKWYTESIYQDLCALQVICNSLAYSIISDVIGSSDME